MSEDVYTKFKVTYYDSGRVASGAGQAGAGRLAIVTMDNEKDWNTPSTLGENALESLRDALDEIEAQTDVKGLLLTGKQFVFAVGADIREFAGMTAESAREAAEAGHTLFRRIKDLPYPTLAAINGAALGGGLEIALHCDYRTLSRSASPIAFPETFLSILPAWGGTQLAPRIVGVDNACKVIIHNALDNNTMLREAQQAYDLGYADELLDPVDFFEDSLTILEELVTGERDVPERAPDNSNVDDVIENAREKARSEVHDGTRAPYLAIDLIEFAAKGGDLDEGYKKEEDALAELLPARQAQASAYSFNLTQSRIKKQPWRPDAAPRDVSKVAIIGAGTMGAQLGAYFLRRLEVPIVMKDIDTDIVEQARESIEETLDKRVQRGRMNEPKARFLKSIVTYTTDYEDVAGADFVLEAVLEKMDLKKQIFSDVEERVDDGAVLASNTSSLSIAEMAADLDHPERVIGFHFFNPVSAMPLLEVIRPDAASDEAMATGFEVSKKLRKSGVQCDDTPAFIANRLMMRFNGAAMEALRHGNDFREIDEAIKEFGLPMGPWELLGFVGVQVAFHTQETLHDAFPERYPLDDNFRRIAEADVDGIYSWETGEPHDEIKEAVEVEDGTERLTADQIRQHALEAITDEARIMIDDGVVADGRDIDTAMLLGAGWPFFSGGPCRYADDTGLSEKLFGETLLDDEDHAFS